MITHTYRREEQCPDAGVDQVDHWALPEKLHDAEDAEDEQQDKQESSADGEVDLGLEREQRQANDDDRGDDQRRRQQDAPHRAARLGERRAGDHGIIGNLHTAALVGTDGTIDCTPKESRVTPPSR